MAESPLYRWRVKRSEHGLSLENFIYRQLGDWSHNQVKSAVNTKRAFVNGKNVFIAKWNVKHNDAVTFAPASVGPGAKAGGKTLSYVDVLYEDDSVILANKPPFVDHEGFAISVRDYLRRRNRGKALPYLGQMHRLDKETSGVMAFTKKKIANALADQFRGRSVRKTYLAIVEGGLPDEAGRIVKPLAKGRFEEGRKARVEEDGGGRSAETRFRVKERYGAATLVGVELLTGRTHQIRVHFADRGYPIVGDKLYGLGHGIAFRRQALHAETLEFTHPVTRRRIRVTAPVPKDMMELIDRLRGT